jgi:hypothetical protein
LLAVTAGEAARANDARQIEASSGDAKPKPSNCLAYGAKFIHTGIDDICFTYSGDVLAVVGYESTSWDIMLSGRRLPTPTNPNGAVPALFYYPTDLTKKTKYPNAGLAASVSATFVKQSELGPIVAFATLRAVGALGSDLSGETTRAFTSFGDPIKDGVIQQSWVSVAGLKVGIQDSLFNFPTIGYANLYGYNSSSYLPAVSFEKAAPVFPGYVTTFGVSLEDNDKRKRADGVLAQYKDEFSPAALARFRIGQRAWTVQASVAAHTIRDAAAFNCCNVKQDATWGWAGSLGCIPGAKNAAPRGYRMKLRDTNSFSKRIKKPLRRRGF